MTSLRDALYNLHPESGSSPEHARGVLVGVVAAFMEAGPFDFHRAVDEVAPYLPGRVMPEAVPENWGLDLARNGVVFDRTITTNQRT
jgi:hypothetical protein